jgi:hypothetical protein
MGIIEQWAEQEGFLGFILDLLLEGLSDEEGWAAPRPGLPPIAWHVGHILVTDAGCYLGMGGNDWSVLPDGWLERFRRGASLPENLTELPSLSQIREQLKPIRTRIASFVHSLDDAILDRPMTHCDPPIVVRAVSTLREALTFLPLHAVFHCGQIGLQRRQLGKPRLL